MAASPLPPGYLRDLRPVGRTQQEAGMFTNFDVIFLMLLLHSIRQGSRMNVFSIKFKKKTNFMV